MTKKKKIIIFAFLLLLLFILSGFVFYFIFIGEPEIYYKLRQEVFTPEPLNEEIEPISSDFGLVIPKIGVNVPVVPNVDGLNSDEYLWQVTEGVAHFKHVEAHDVIVDGAFPGQEGNVFLFGHSQIPGGDTSKYQAVFNDLPLLAFGDKILVYYQGEKYEYRILESQVVEKTDLYYLEKTEVETLRLMTCYPLGFNNQRYLITAERID